jgi:hypothetical protein
MIYDTNQEAVTPHALPIPEHTAIPEHRVQDGPCDS